MYEFRALASWTLWVVAAASGLTCGRAAREELTLAGSTSLQPFAEKWADAYGAAHPEVAIHIQGGGSTAGVQAAISGAAQIGMSSRTLSADESGRVQAFAVARDCIVVIVHPSQYPSDLTLDQLRAIYTGEIGNWRVLGGLDAPITLITREEGSGTRAAFEGLVMGARRIAARALVQDSTGAVRQMVASDPAAIGYVSTGFVDGSVKALKLQGAEATESEIDGGRYPLVRPFLFVTPAAPSATARDFIAWITGPAGRELTRREGLLPPGA
jgi:phosphate transport system substrate-binding protein